MVQEEKKIIDAQQLLHKLKGQNVFVYLEKADLKVKFNGSVLPPDLLNEIKENKESLVTFLSNSSPTKAGGAIPPAPEAGDYPLSSSQYRLWVLSQFEDGNVAYNMPGVFVFDGSFHAEAFESAFDYLLNRHESLRTIFRQTEGGEVRQYILPAEQIGLKISYIDLRQGLSPNETAREAISRDFACPFNLAQGPLVRASIYQVEDRTWIFAYTLHHIISDGWSMGILMHELFLAYNAYAKQSIPNLRPLSIQYKDYAVWQQAQLIYPHFQEHKKYWLNQFNHDCPVLDLPSDRPRPPVKTYNGSIVTRTVDADTAERLKNYCQRSGGTLFMGLLSVVNLLLYKYSGQEDIVIGSPIAGRDHIDLENQIGFYVNTLALRSTFSRNHNFYELFQIVKKVTLEAYYHQAYPFDDLVEAVLSERDRSRNPLFDVMVVLQNTNGGKAANTNHTQGLADINVTGYEQQDRVTSLFDLRFDFKETAAGIHLLIEYNNDIFDKWRIEQMGNHVLRLLEAVMTAPASPIDRLEYISEAERNQLLNLFNNTATEYPNHTTLVDLFDANVRSRPTDIALIFRNQAFSYAHLNVEANKLAHFLVSGLNANLESKIGILLTRSQWMAISMLGTLKAGCAYVPLDPDYPEDRLIYMLHNSEIEVMITEKACAELANKIQWQTPGLKHLVCIDTQNFYKEEGGRENALMKKDLWDSVGDTAHDEIAAGGWMSSYTGQYFSIDEMREYADNIFAKLSPYLNTNMRVLEVGCSSGLTMFRLAPLVSEYHGVDISSSILGRTRNEADQKQIRNLTLTCLAAHEIDKLVQSDFDLIIFNSVIHCFNGHNYFYNVLTKAIGKLKSTGMLFLGDVMDEEKRNDLIQDFLGFKKNNAGRAQRTKTDWSKELFISRNFLTDYATSNSSIFDIQFSEKIHTIPNELTRYRYDALLKVDKTQKVAFSRKRTRYQHDQRIISAQPAFNPTIPLTSENLAYVIYTSGSTGRPKGCMLEHRGVVNRIEWMWKYYQFTREDVILQKTTFTFDVSVWEFFLPLCWGGRMIVCEKTDIASPEKIVELIEKEKVTCLHFVPGMLNAFMGAVLGQSNISTRLSSINKLFTSGEALTPSTVKHWFEKLDIPIYNLYGPTEVSIDVTYYNVAAEDSRIPIGKPIANTQVYILDRSDALVPVGVRGEICLAGDGLARGYLNELDLSNTKFVTNPFVHGRKMYRTGDVGQWLPDGNIDFVGRLDQQVKVRGHRIELQEIEVAVKSVYLCESIIVHTIRNREGETELVVYLKTTEPVSAGDLRMALSSVLPVYMVPNHFVAIEEVPRTASGKIDRRRLPNPYQSLKATTTGYVAARNEVEEQLCSLYEEVLGRKPVGISDDFFELGGDSFKAIRLASKFGKRLSILDIYNYPAIGELAEHLAKASKPGLLQKLTENKINEEISIVIVPYGAGEPFAYIGVSASLTELNPQASVYCLNLPRTELPHDINLFSALETVADELMNEIRDKIATPIVLYGKCIGAGITMEIARRLELQNLPLKAVCIGGAMATLKIPPREEIFVSSMARINYLKRIGATVPAQEEDQAIFIRNVHWDIAVGVTSFNNWLINLKAKMFRKLSTPLYCIVGTQDPTTPGFRRRYKDWELYADNVKLITIEGAGHYLSRDKPRELARILHLICNGDDNELYLDQSDTGKGAIKPILKKLSRILNGMAILSSKKNGK